MYTISPEFAAISGDARPPVNVIPDTAPVAPVSIFPLAVDACPTTALAAFDSNALTTPESLCNSGD